MLSEAQVVLWLKRRLLKEGLHGYAAREIVVDADGSYLRSPFRRQLEPTGTIWIGEWRPDLVCVIERAGTEYLAGFEVKATSDHEKGVVQASRYRNGVHEAYLCIPTSSSPRDWLRQAAASNGIGLVRAGADRLHLEVEPAPPRPDPKLYVVTRRYLLGETGTRSFGLNKPLHYAAALMAYAFTDGPAEALARNWKLQESAIRMAVRGAQTLGLLAGHEVTVKGWAYAAAFQSVGFTLPGCRPLTSKRLVVHGPSFAALLRPILLDHPAVELVVQTLVTAGGGPMSIEELARRAHRADEGMARALFGPPPIQNEPRAIRSWVRFTLKAALYDVGLLDSPLAPRATSPQGPGGYDPRVDVWCLGIACDPRRSQAIAVN